MHRIIKTASTALRRLAEIYHSQAVHQRTQKHSNNIASPGGTGLHRQAVHQGTQNTHNLACTAWRLCIASQADFGKFPKIHVTE